MTPFETRVLSLVGRIPPGFVTTYGTIAALAGHAGAARAVGNILRRSTRPGIPYHRVIAAGGALGGYSDRQTKIALLRAEGHVVRGRRLPGFRHMLWAGPAQAARQRPSPRRRPTC